MRECKQRRRTAVTDERKPMMNATLAFCSLGIALSTVSAVHAPTSSASPSGSVVPVTIDILPLNPVESDKSLCYEEHALEVSL
jgi:hypothetical protein